jgi:hypothetical protein
MDCGERKGRACKVRGLKSNGVNTARKGSTLLPDCTEVLHWSHSYLTGPCDQGTRFDWPLPEQCD